MHKKCDKCEYNWNSRIQEPKACPRCKRRFDYPKIRNSEIGPIKEKDSTSIVCKNVQYV